MEPRFFRPGVPPSSGSDSENRRGRVTVPRFYAAVRDPSPDEKASWERLPFREADYLQELGVDVSPGEDGYGILERRWSRPTLDVHGIAGGWTGAGPKTVIPARAVAKISMRLVPDQRAKTLFRAYEKRVRKLVPPGVQVEVPEDIQAAIWGKFLFIASISGVGAVTHAPLGVVRRLPEARRMARAARAWAWPRDRPARTWLQKYWL